MLALLHRFERSRKGSNEDDAYKTATAGTHLSGIKKKKMLAGWVLDGGECGKNFKGFQMEFGLTKSAGVFTDWLSQQEATTKYGESQLKAMVAAGTIESRRFAKDPRFFEFKAASEKQSTVVHGGKTVTLSGPKMAITNDEVVAFSKVDTDQMMATDFDFDGDFVGYQPSQASDLAKALKMKDDVPKKDSKDPKHKGRDPLEELSQVLPGDSKGAIKKKTLSFKEQIDKEVNMLQQMNLQLQLLKKTKEQRETTKMIDLLEHVGSSLNLVIKATNPKKEDQKRVLLDGYKYIMQGKTLRKALTRLLPPRKKQAKEKEAGEYQEEEEA